ncbi:unknown similar to AMEV088 [Mythimna separata entomopoxvirus 'L']|uniref:Uncharacterized protein n=1 Tax=Mythimna separata entomopoxvirus 'L' TaxID=1293572 RepID=A0A916KQ33_9POXV|nr:unknown similar to AMEV088 [Mythimna separata entomopoxvirus 'L']CCU56309.1 unknown similar to AMEV088 [Mythimna separata entomopoxvirus 'L']
MSYCTGYSDDIVMEYRVPIKTNVNVQSGTITSKANTYGNPPRSNCNSCSNGYSSNGYSSNGYSSNGYGGSNAGYNNGVGGYTSAYSSNTVRTVGNNWDNNPSCVVETRGNNRYRTCYYRDGTSTIETYPV